MSFYNMVFGQNPFSDLLLQVIGLTKKECGRFRDCYVEDGMICVYTRNGGGNRECWHEGYPKHGSQSCKHHIVTEMQEQWLECDEDQVPEGARLGATILGGTKTRRRYTIGNLVPTDFYVCEAPDSVECGCPGCLIQYRLPKHPLYIKDRDDDFDSTYATIYFRIPDEYKDAVGDQGESGEAKWQKLFEALSTNREPAS